MSSADPAVNPEPGKKWEQAEQSPGSWPGDHVVVSIVPLGG